MSQDSNPSRGSTPTHVRAPNDEDSRSNTEQSSRSAARVTSIENDTDGSIRPRTRFDGDARAASEIVGYALLVGLIVLGSGLVAFGGGMDALETMQDRPVEDNAQQSMAQFAAEASAVGHGAASTRQVDVAPRASATRTVDPDVGTFRIIVEEPGEAPETVFEVPLGAVVFEAGDIHIAYQAGGIWQKTGDDSYLVSEPNVYYRSDPNAEDQTLTISLVTIEDEAGETGETVRITQSDTDGAEYTVEGDDDVLDDTRVIVEVESPYAEGWYDYFESRTPGNPDRDGDTVSTIVRDTHAQPLTRDAVLGTAGSDDVEIGTDGDVEIDGDVFFSSDLIVDGDSDDVTVSGDLEATDVEDAGNNLLVGGEVVEHSAPRRASITSELSQAIADFNARNLENTGERYDNVEPDPEDAEIIDEDAYVAGDIAPDEDASVYIGSPVEEDPPDEIGVEVDGEIKAADDADVNIVTDDSDVFVMASELKFGDESTLSITGDGHVEIIADDVTMADSSAIEIDGDATVEFYVQRRVEFEGQPTADTDRTPENLWMYAQDDVSFDGDGISFEGTVYSPDAHGILGGNVDLYGSILTSQLVLEDGDVSIEYADALENEEPFADPDRRSSVVYVHASEEPIIVE